MNQAMLPLKFSGNPKQSVQVVDDAEAAHQRALEGLPHYWKLSWDWTDKIMADCGKHQLLVRVDWLEDSKQKINTSCHYKELGLCNE